MPGLLYTFERDKGADQAAHKRRPSTDAIIAIAVASTGMQRVRYEELTDSLNATPVIAVVFADDVDKSEFENRLPRILAARALAVRKVTAPEEPHATSQLPATEP